MLSYSFVMFEFLIVVLVTVYTLFYLLLNIIIKNIIDISSCNFELVILKLSKDCYYVLRVVNYGVIWSIPLIWFMIIRMNT